MGVLWPLQKQIEFWDRALGCRSIIADPRFEKTKDKINANKMGKKYRPCTGNY